MIRFCLSIGLLLVAGLSLPVSAQTVNSPSTADFDSAAPGRDDGPVLPAGRQHWPGAIVIAILGVFVSAAVIGPIVRANTPPNAEEFNPSPEARPPGRP